MIDLNDDSSILLIRSLRRRFPSAQITRCKESQSALQAVATRNVEVVIIHRTEQQDAVTLVRTIRALEPTAVIIAVSSIDRSEQVLAAGATGFLDYNRCLILGQVVANALAAASPLSPEAVKGSWSASM